MIRPDDANRISISAASGLGISAPVREVENGRELIILRDDKPVAVTTSMNRLEQLQESQEALQDLTLAAARMATSNGEELTLDEVIERFGYSRADLAERPGADLAPETPAKTPGPFRPVDPATHPLFGK